MKNQQLKINIPNAISFGRLLAVPFVVWLVLNKFYEVAFWLFLAACISDGVDGFIAKKFALRTELGGFLDPIADKALLVCVFITLGNEDQISIWLVIIVVFRDSIIICGALLYRLLYQSLSVDPLLISKINTLAQFIFAALILGNTAFDVADKSVLQSMEYIIGFTTIVSGASYVYLWWRKAIAMELRK